MQKRSIVIIGSSGLAREVRWLIDECNKIQNRWNVLGWVSREIPGTIISGLPVLGDDDWLISHKDPIDVAVSVGDGSLRKRIVERLKVNTAISFPVIVSPTVELSSSVILGEGSIVTSKCILTVDIKIGKFFFCNLACTVGHDCVFEDYVTLNPGANISGNVTLKECVTIGTGAAIIQGKTVFEKSIIGAGASVVRDVQENSTAVGVPARAMEKKQ